LKLLKDILYKVAITAVHGSTGKSICAIEFDSRKVKPNSLFIAQKGLIYDGHQFIDKAIELGVTAVVCEEMPANFVENITYVQVEDANMALAIMAANFYDNPSSKLKLIGVTGTNGKTTIASLLYNLYQKAGYKSGLLSTVNILVDNELYETSHTTPNSVD